MEIPLLEGKCCKCEGKYTDYGSDPFPLCELSDETSRVCAECYKDVILARYACHKAGCETREQCREYAKGFETWTKRHRLQMRLRMAIERVKHKSKRIV